MESQAAEAMPLHDIIMSSSDLKEKSVIDSGGFGKVYLCFHRTIGLVVQKTVFTGSKHESYSKDLLEEGEIMYKLKHERIVKLLGIILEDSNYSLVIEYMPKGHLLKVLKQIAVPDSVKARFILEIIEGMVYLHNQTVIHKDLKPENILADDEFHIKIADLGAAGFQKWSTLTKEETARQKSLSKSGKANTSNAGTLSYMAPEHLKSINQKATQKSDVYSFGIVIWVILNNKEPYENALNDPQISHCVSDGQRPEVDARLNSCLEEASDLMQECWKAEPGDRPSFKDCEETFRPIYTVKYEKDIETDVATMKRLYPNPDKLVQRLASLQIDCDAELPSMPSRDHPQSLHSSPGFAHGNVNESMFGAFTNEPVEPEHEKHDDALERKLQEEMNYHRTGSRIDHVTNINPSDISEMRSRKVFNVPANFSSNIMSSGSNIAHPVHVGYGNDYESGPGMYGSATGHTDDHLPIEHSDIYNPALPHSSWSAAATTPASMAHPGQQPPNFDPYNSTKVPVAESMPNMYLPNPAFPFTAGSGHQIGTVGSNMFFGYPQQCSSEKPVFLTISNSKAIQIGDNNVMRIDRKMHTKDNPDKYEIVDVFGNNSLINETQLHLLRSNLSRKWKEFARCVGFRQPEIDEIDHDYERDGLKEKVYQMLHKWQMKEGSKNSTVGKVATALYSLGETDLLNKLIQMN
ncbi:receptor-interacting serine/threonine-protein kinase 1 [Pseudophryne corroboree]|uniref:receptor-interacting serine/threonine-protein kinase 1 n=1 Tax=Pseudophryne corroboree TaxID=495146 RepID=UPI003081B617